MENEKSPLWGKVPKSDPLIAKRHSIYNLCFTQQLLSREIIIIRIISIIKYNDLGRRVWGKCWYFLTLFSYFSHHPTALVWAHAHSGNIRRKDARRPGLKVPPGLRACLKWRAFRGGSTSENNGNIINNNIRWVIIDPWIKRPSESF